MLTVLLILILVGRTAAILIFRQQTMHHHVGITTDGRGEMGVVVEGESIVSDIMHTVLGLHHRPQSHCLDGILLTCALSSTHQGIERLSDGSLRATRLHLIAEFRHELAQVLEFLRIGLVVDTIRQRLCLLPLLHTSDGLCHRLISQQHELLDEFVGIFRHLEVSLDGFARLIDIEVEFLAIKLHGAILETGSTQFLGKGIKFDQFGSVFSLIGMILRSRGRWFACAILHAIILQNLLHLLIGIATIALNHRMSQMPLLDVRLVVHLEDDTITEFLLVRTQRADEIAETLWQHGDGAVDEVDTRCTGIGLLVDDGAFLHVMRDIGDMDAYLPEPIVELTDREGIVEVLGILGVDGAGKHVAHILTTVNFLLGDGGINLLCRLLHVLRILVGQVVLSQDGMHLGIVLACLSEDINDRADNVLMLTIRPLRHLYHCLVVRLTALELTLGDNDIVDEGRILRNEESHVLLHTQTTDYLVTSTTYDLNDQRLLDMLVATSHIRYFHTVAIHRRHRVTLSHEHRGAPIIGQERVTSV